MNIENHTEKLTKFLKKAKERERIHGIILKRIQKKCKQEYVEENKRKRCVQKC